MVHAHSAATMAIFRQQMVWAANHPIVQPANHRAITMALPVTRNHVKTTHGEPQMHAPRIIRAKMNPSAVIVSMRINSVPMTPVTKYAHPVYGETVLHAAFRSMAKPHVLTEIADKNVTMQHIRIFAQIPA